MKIHYVRPIDLHDYAPRCDNDPCRPVVEKADCDALAARLAEAEALLREARDPVEHTAKGALNLLHTEVAQDLFSLVNRIDKFNSRPRT